MKPLAEYFERKTRENGDAFYTLTDDRPDWLHEAVRDAHEGEMPDDWRYETCCNIAHALDDEYLVTEDDVFEWADGQVDVYTSDLLRWLSDNLNRASEVDEAYDEMGWPQEGGFVRLLMWAQMRVIERMARILYDAYTENKDEEE